MNTHTLSNKLPAIPSRSPDRPINEAQERWWIAKVKPRQEKQLALDFIDQGVEYYLPMYTKKTPRTDSKTPRVIHTPLFPGYISFSQEKPSGIYSTGRIVSLIEVRNQKRFINELNQIYYLLQGNAPIAPAPANAYPIGTPIQITHGPFAGTSGVISGSSASTIIISVECLGSATLKIDPAWIKEAQPVANE